MVAAVAALFLLFPFVSPQFYRESFFTSNDAYGSLYANFQDLQKRVEKLEEQVVGLQHAAHQDWNSTNDGAMFKLFEERKNWENSEKYCRSLNAHLVVVDNEEKNKFVTSLINSSPTADFVWIGMKTKATTRGFNNEYSNFNENSPIDGCAVADTNGVWSIRSCAQLRPFVCQMVTGQV